MEHRFAGPKAMTILGLNSGTIDLTLNGWGHQVLICQITSSLTKISEKNIERWHRIAIVKSHLNW